MYLQAKERDYEELLLMDVTVLKIGACTGATLTLTCFFASIVEGEGLRRASPNVARRVTRTRLGKGGVDEFGVDD